MPAPERPHIDIDDYRHDARDRGWGHGWPSCTGAQGQLLTITTTPSRTQVPVHRRIAVLSDLLLHWTEDPTGGNYPLKPEQCGGYKCRPIDDTQTPSNHSWGLAIDLNWHDNPYPNTGQHTIPERVPRMWNRYGFAWGGDYTDPPKDYMHLEFMGTPNDADTMTQVALAELAPTHHLDPILERALAPGRNVGTIIVPTGSASSIVARAWVSVRAAGGVTFDPSVGGGIWFQISAPSDGPAPGAGDPYQAQLKAAERGVHEIPDRTEYLEYNITATGPGALAVELLAK